MKPIRALVLILAAVGLIGPVIASSSAATLRTKGAGTIFPRLTSARQAALCAAEMRDLVDHDHNRAGSGADRQVIVPVTVAFSAVDIPLDRAELEDKAIVQIPTPVGGPVPVVDVPGEVVLDGPTLVDPSMGRVGAWEDRAIAARNPHLPSSRFAVTVVRRSTGSDSTRVFAAHLARLSNREPSRLGQSSSVSRPVGIAGEGGRGGAADRPWDMAPLPMAGPGGPSWPIVSGIYALRRRIDDDATASLSLKP